MSLFEVGDIVDTNGVRVAITRTSGPDCLLVEVIIAENLSEDVAIIRAFPVGTSLRFMRVRDTLAWKIFPDEVANAMPWFVLSIHDGRKRFEHYR